MYGTPGNLGEAAAERVEGHLASAIARRGGANLVLASAMSQLSFLQALQGKAIEWARVAVFHLDEYTELPEDHPASFRRFLRERILDAVRPGRVHLIRGDADDLETEIERYESLLRSHPIDVACIGIGENGHIAFNDPPVADFADARLVKEVELDDACRRQQVNEGWFPSFEATPRCAVTLTVPAIMSSGVISCVVPGERKADAVHGRAERARRDRVSRVDPAPSRQRHALSGPRLGGTRPDTRQEKAGLPYAIYHIRSTDGAGSRERALPRSRSGAGADPDHGPRGSAPGPRSPSGFRSRRESWLPPGTCAC